LGKSKALILIALLCLNANAFAQQPVQFSQYMFNDLIINPAYAGADGALSLTFVNRSQWSGIENAPTTQTLSAHTLVKNEKVGLGATVVNDKVGVHKDLTIATNYAYHLPVAERSYLSLGLLMGFSNKRSDYQSLTGGTVNDPKIRNARIADSFFEAGAGIYFRSPKWRIGLSAPALIPHGTSINDTLSVQLDRRHFFMLSKYRFSITQNLDLEPSFLIKYLSGLPVSFDANVNAIYREVLTFGASYRKSESVNLLLKAQVTSQLEVGYVYDYGIGEVSRYSNGSHELMIHYHFQFTKTNVSSPR